MKLRHSYFILSSVQRVDIYSLGVILFEMFYRPMPIMMERVSVLTELRREKVVFPKDWPKERLANQTRLICAMLQHDPYARPSASVSTILWCTFFSNCLLVVKYDCEYKLTT